MILLENCSLKDKHTFHIPAKTRYWADYESVDDLCSLLKNKDLQGLSVFPIGGGSNLLFTGDYAGLLIHSTIQTIEPVIHPDNSVSVRVGSGVVWDDFVAFAVENGWSGVENLSGIPGDIGASPVQNIGAYGSEAKDSIEMVEALNLQTLQMQRFTNADCSFGYRTSIFKNSLKNNFAVCYVTYRLSKDLNANIQYGDLAERIRKKGGVSLSNIRHAILETRNEKLPDPTVFGNAGSFFMNPVISAEQFQSLKEAWPSIPAWPLENGKVKVSAAWCIDQAGWKGKSLSNAAVHSNQPLVLVNPGKATAADILALSNRIILDVKEKFGIDLVPEVLFI